MYTESLNENYIFCVRSNIQIDNKSERTIPLCRLVCDVTSATLAHVQTAARRPPSQPESLDWMAALVKSQRKSYTVLPEGLYLGESRRFVQMKCLVHQLCQRRKWLGFEMKSVMYFTHGGPPAILQRGESSVSQSPPQSVFTGGCHVQLIDNRQPLFLFLCVLSAVSLVAGVCLSAVRNGRWSTICY